MTDRTLWVFTLIRYVSVGAYFLTNIDTSGDVSFFFFFFTNLAFRELSPHVFFVFVNLIMRPFLYHNCPLYSTIYSTNTAAVVGVKKNGERGPYHLVHTET